MAAQDFMYKKVGILNQMFSNINTQTEDPREREQLYAEMRTNFMTQVTQDASRLLKPSEASQTIQLMQQTLNATTSGLANMTKSQENIFNNFNATSANELPENLKIMNAILTALPQGAVELWSRQNSIDFSAMADAAYKEMVNTHSKNLVPDRDWETR